MEKVYYESFASARRTPNIIASGSMLITSLVLSVTLFHKCSDFWHINNSLWPRVFLVGLFAVIVTVFIFGLVGALAAIRNKKVGYRITDYGINFGENRWPWERIERFGALNVSDGYVICFHVKGAFSDRCMNSDTRLTHDQCVALMQKLTPYTKCIPSGRNGPQK